jgi:hypothetical protein
MSNTLTMTLSGQALPLYPTTAKDSGNEYHAFRLPNGKFTGFGEAISALADELPTSVEIEGVTIYLERGMTADKDRSGRKLDQRPKVSYQGHVTLPDGSIKTARVSISLTKDENWNVVAALFGAGGGSGTRKVRDLSEFFAK